VVGSVKRIESSSQAELSNVGQLDLGLGSRGQVPDARREHVRTLFIQQKRPMPCGHRIVIRSKSLFARLHNTLVANTVDHSGKARYGCALVQRENVNRFDWRRLPVAIPLCERHSRMRA
jgi:hypothetical protein